MASPKPTGTEPVWSAKRNAFIVRARVEGKRRIVVIMGAKDAADAAAKAPQAIEAAKSQGLAAPATPAPASKSAETVDAWFERWLPTRVHKRTARPIPPEDAQSLYRNRIQASLGQRPIAEVSREEIERLVERLDAEVQAGTIKPKTARNAWGLVTSMFKAARKSKVLGIRACESNPTADVEGPDGGLDAEPQYLYPSEWLKLATCAGVPVRWRRLYGLAIYSGMRSGELRAIDVPDVDFEHGNHNIHESFDYKRKKRKSTKGGSSRKVAMETELIPLYRTLIGDRTDGPVVVDMPSQRTLARNLREHLKRAGVTRPELFDDEGPTAKPIVFHDLRATFCTWMAVRGDSASKIKQRAGHRDIATSDGYIREADPIRENFGTPFPPIPAELLDVEVDAKVDVFGGSQKVPVSMCARSPENQERGGRDSKTLENQAVASERETTVDSREPTFQSPTLDPAPDEKSPPPRPLAADPLDAALAKLTAERAAAESDGDESRAQEITSAIVALKRVRVQRPDNVVALRKGGR